MSGSPGANTRPSGDEREPNPTGTKGRDRLQTGALQEDGADLILRGVEVRYDGGRAAVRVDRLQVLRGETVLFLGPSGSGKSTLALLCAGLLPGAVEAEATGEVWRSDRVSGPGRTGCVFQDPESQFCMLQVGDETAFGLENLSVAREEMPGRIRAALGRAGLSVGLGEDHAVFSGGMKQKLAIAAALAMDAEMLVLDEPTANLDPAATSAVFGQIAALRKSGKTLIVIEHKFAPILSIADRVVLFERGGRVRSVCTPAEVVAREWDWLRREGVAAPWAEPPLLSRAAGGGRFFHSPASEPGEDAGTKDAPPGTSDPELEVGTKAPKDEAIRLTGGVLRYGGQTVWENIDWRVPRGALVAIVGSNGAGKTSLLQVCAGFTRLCGGSLARFGEEVAAGTSTTSRLSRLSLRLGRRGKQDVFERVGFVFQNPEHQFIFERVGDELANRMVRGALPEDALRRLEEFSLDGLADQSPFALSQGQKRRLSVAVAIREERDLYLLDEPTFGQDARTQALLMDRLARLCSEGRTVVFTTHDLDLVRRYATRVLVLANRKAVYEGPPGPLFLQPGILHEAGLDGAGAGAGEDGVEGVGAKGGEDGAGLGFGAERVASEAARLPLARRVNPPLHLAAALVSTGIAVFATTLWQAAAVFTMPILWMRFAAGLRFRLILLRMSPFLVFYALYVWSFTAFSAVAPGTAVLRILWWRASLSGFLTGVALALRMLSAVGFGALFVSSADITDLVVGLSQNLRVPPRFSYGVMAGLRVIPLFREEWTKLRRARQLRGRDAPAAFFRVATYALPLLSQAVRMSERVALAMEARGFHGPPAERADGRTYYREIRILKRDWVYAFAMAASVAAALVGASFAGPR